jgi:hypothetical protein
VESDLGKPIPSLDAFLVCDQVITDSRTRKTTLVGLFGRIVAEGFPVIVDLGVFVRFSDMEGVYTIRIDVAHAQSNRIVMTADGQISVTSSPLNLTEFGFPLRFSCDQPGRYEFRLYVDELFLGRTTIHIAGPEGVM